MAAAAAETPLIVVCAPSSNLPSVRRTSSGEGIMPYDDSGLCDSVDAQVHTASITSITDLNGMVLNIMPRGARILSVPDIVCVHLRIIVAHSQSLRCMMGAGHRLSIAIPLHALPHANNGCFQQGTRPSQARCLTDGRRTAAKLTANTRQVRRFRLVVLIPPGGPSLQHSRAGS
jgi:hypothetical protein